jgi:S1-C subfamily serine protease
MTAQSNENVLQSLSDRLADAVEHAGKYVVRVDDGSRLTATGIAWSADGLVVATSHGTERDDDLAIFTGDGERHAATLVGRDEESDIVLLRVSDSARLTPAELGDDNAARLGQLVIAVGRPGLGGLQATLGIVGLTREMTSAGRVEHLIGTDATLYPGFSGGPLIDVAGRVLGVNNRAFGRGQTIAIGVTLIRHVVDSLLTGGTVKRGYLGVSTQAVILPETLRTNLSVAQRNGLLVVQVAEGGPAEKAGLTLGDTLLKLNGQELDAVDDLRYRLRSTQAGETVALNFVHGGKLKEIDVVVGAVG